MYILFSDETCSSTTVFIFLSHAIPINFFFRPSFRFFSADFLTWFLSLLILESSVILQLFFQIFGSFFFFFGCCECWLLPKTHGFSNVSHAPQIKIKRRCKKTCPCVQGNETDFGHTHSGQAMRIFKQKKKKISPFKNARGKSSCKTFALHANAITVSSKKNIMRCWKKLNCTNSVDMKTNWQVFDKNFRTYW